MIRYALNTGLISIYEVLEFRYSKQKEFGHEPPQNNTDRSKYGRQPLDKLTD